MEGDSPGRIPAASTAPLSYAQILAATGASGSAATTGAESQSQSSLGFGYDSSSTRTTEKTDSLPRSFQRRRRVESGGGSYSSRRGGLAREEGLPPPAPPRFSDSISRFNPKFHSLPKDRTRFENPQLGSSSESMASPSSSRRGRGRGRARPQQQYIRGRPRSFEEEPPPPEVMAAAARERESRRQKTTSLIIESENPVPARQHLLGVSPQVRRRSRSPMWRPGDAECPSFSEMLRQRAQSEEQLAIRRKVETETYIHVPPPPPMTVQQFEDAEEAQQPAVMEVPEIVEDPWGAPAEEHMIMAAVPEPYRQQDVFSLVPVEEPDVPEPEVAKDFGEDNVAASPAPEQEDAVFKVEGPEEEHPSIPGLLFKKELSGKKIERRRSSKKKGQAAKVDSGQENLELAKIFKPKKGGTLPKQESLSMTVAAASVGAAPTWPSREEEGEVEKKLAKEEEDRKKRAEVPIRRRKSRGSKKKNESGITPKRESREFRDEMAKMKRRRSGKQPEEKKPGEQELKAEEPRQEIKEKKKVDEEEKMAKKPSLSRRQRRKSSKKKVVSLPQDAAVKEDSEATDYHRGMSTDVIAKYLQDLEKDDFEFVHPEQEEKKVEVESEPVEMKEEGEKVESPTSSWSIISPSEGDSKDLTAQETAASPEDILKEKEDISKEGESPMPTGTFAEEEMVAVPMVRGEPLRNSWATVASRPKEKEDSEVEKDKPSAVVHEKAALVVEVEEPKLEVKETDSDGFERAMSQKKRKGKKREARLSLGQDKAEEIAAEVSDAGRVDDSKQQVDNSKPAKKSYDMLDDSSSAWMDVELGTLSSADDEEELVPAVAAVNKVSPNKKEAGSPAKKSNEGDPQDKRKSYEMQDDMSAAWMEAGPMSFESEEEEAEIAKEGKRKAEEAIPGKVKEEKDSQSAPSKKSYELQDDFSSAWMDAGPMAFEDSDEEPVVGKGGENEVVKKGNMAKDGGDAAAVSTSLPKEEKALPPKDGVDAPKEKKSYELQDDLSSAWMEAGPMSFEEEHEEKKRPEAEYKPKKSYEIQDDFSSAWMDAGPMSFDSEEEEEGKEIPRVEAPLQEHSGGKHMSFAEALRKPASPLPERDEKKTEEEIGKMKEVLPLVVADEEEQPAKEEEVDSEGFVTFVPKKRTRSKKDKNYQPSENVIAASKEVEKLLDNSTASKTEIAKVKDEKSTQSENPPSQGDKEVTKRTFEMQDDLSSAWMDAGPMSFDSEEDEDSNKKAQIPSIDKVIVEKKSEVDSQKPSKKETEERNKNESQKPTEEKPRKSYEIQDDFSSAWMDAGPMSIESDEDEAEPAPCNDVKVVEEPIAETSHLAPLSFAEALQKPATPLPDKDERVEEKDHKKIEEVVPLIVADEAEKPQKKEDEVDSEGFVTFVPKKRTRSKKDKNYKPNEALTSAPAVSEKDGLIGDKMSEKPESSKAEVKESDKSPVDKGQDQVRKSYELQDDLSGAWMDAGPMSFESEEEETEMATADNGGEKGKEESTVSTKTLTAVAASQEGKGSKIAQDDIPGEEKPAAVRGEIASEAPKEKKSYEMMDDLSGAWMDAGPMSFSSEGEEEEKKEEEIAKTNSSENKIGKEEVKPRETAPKVPERPLSLVPSWMRKDKPQQARPPPQQTHSVPPTTAEMDLEGGIFGSSKGRERFEAAASSKARISSISSVEDPQDGPGRINNSNTADDEGEDNKEKRDRVRKKRKRPHPSREGPGVGGKGSSSTESEKAEKPLVTLPPSPNHSVTVPAPVRTQKTQKETGQEGKPEKKEEVDVKALPPPLPPREEPKVLVVEEEVPKAETRSLSDANKKSATSDEAGQTSTKQQREERGNAGGLLEGRKVEIENLLVERDWTSCFRQREAEIKFVQLAASTKEEIAEAKVEESKAAPPIQETAALPLSDKTDVAQGQERSKKKSKKGKGKDKEKSRSRSRGSRDKDVPSSGGGKADESKSPKAESTKKTDEKLKKEIKTESYEKDPKKVVKSSTEPKTDVAAQVFGVQSDKQPASAMPDLIASCPPEEPASTAAAATKSKSRSPEKQAKHEEKQRRKSKDKSASPEKRRGSKKSGGKDATEAMETVETATVAVELASADKDQTERKVEALMEKANEEENFRIRASASASAVAAETSAREPPDKEKGFGCRGGLMLLDRDLVWGNWGECNEAEKRLVKKLNGAEKATLSSKGNLEKGKDTLSGGEDFGSQLSRDLVWPNRSECNEAEVRYHAEMSAKVKKSKLAAMTTRSPLPVPPPTPPPSPVPVEASVESVSTKKSHQQVEVGAAGRKGAGEQPPPPVLCSLQVRVTLAVGRAFFACPSGWCSESPFPYYQMREE